MMKSGKSVIQSFDVVKKNITVILAKKNKSIFNNSKQEIEDYVNKVHESPDYEIIRCAINIAKAADTPEFLEECIRVFQDEYGMDFPIESTVAFLQKHVARDKPLERAPKTFKVKWTKQLCAALTEWHNEYLIKTNQLDAMA